MTDTPTPDECDARRLPLADDSVQCIVTSPPYWGQRVYGVPDEIGREETWPEYVAAMVDCGREWRRVLKPDGVLWLNIGDTYNTRTIIRPSAHQGGLGHDNDSIRMSWAEARDAGMVRYSARQPSMKDKDLMLLPFRVAAAFVDDGWFLRCDVVWSKPYGSPENAHDRPTRMHEYIFMLTPTGRTKFDKAEAPRSVWEIAPTGQPGHPAAFPDALVRPCVASSSVPGDLVVDPFGGSGTVARVAREMGRCGATYDAAGGPVR